MLIVRHVHCSVRFDGAIRNFDPALLRAGLRGSLAGGVSLSGSGPGDLRLALSD